MKYEWEPEDIVTGRVVRHSQTKATNNKYIICCRLHNPSLQFFLISLSDGFTITEEFEHKGLAEWLNVHKYEPTDDDRETTRAIDYLRGVR